MTDAQKATFAWWCGRMPRYNLGLIVAGMGAFILHVLIGSFMLRNDAEFEVTFFTLIGGGFALSLHDGDGEPLHLPGPLGELFWAPQNPGSYRRFWFNLGFWGSCALPFFMPLLLVLQAAGG